MDDQYNACDLLLTGGSVITVDDDRRVLEPGAVAIAGDRIVAVGTPEELAEYQAVRTIDCTGKAVIPGLIDAHNHLMESLGRSLGEGMALWPWLRDFDWPYAIAISSDEAQIATTLGAIEAIRAGTTTIVDNFYAPTDLDTTLAVAAAIDGAGLRAAVARGILGEVTPIAERGGLAVDLFRYSTDEEIAITTAAIEAYPPGGRVEVWPAPLNIPYNDQDLVRRSVALARELGTHWHTHCSEAAIDPDLYVEEFGIRPVAWLYQEGLLGPEATLAHAIFLDEAEVEACGETHTGIAYNPVSNQYLASGVLRLRDLRSSGAVVGLGTDGPCCNHRQDMFEVMKQAVLLQRVSTLDPTVSNAEEALEMATREGARYVGIDAGVLAVGKLADVVVIDLEQPHLTPHNRTVAAIVYAARGSDVVYTIVGGRIVYEDGSCTLVDEAQVMREATVRSRELIERAGLEPLLVPWRFDPGQ